MIGVAEIQTLVAKTDEMSNAGEVKKAVQSSFVIFARIVSEFDQSVAPRAVLEDITYEGKDYF